jgi:predicted dehydrogenase
MISTDTPGGCWKRAGAASCRGQPAPLRDASLFLSKAIAAGRLGKLLQADCYVKWHRSAEYYSRPIKGSWQTEGGRALSNQAIHGIDIVRWLAGPVKEVFGVWQLGALHKIESEDVINAVMKFAGGATGVIQASTAFWPVPNAPIPRPAPPSFRAMLTTWDVTNDSATRHRSRMKQTPARRIRWRFRWNSRTPVPDRRCYSQTPQPMVAGGKATRP